MNYLHYDIYSIRAGLKDVLHNSAAVARNTGSMASSLKKFQTVMDRGFIGVQSELSDIYNQLDDLLDIMIDFRNTQFIQNETRNQLLASIDRTLKAPNKTAAHEQYEISLELAQKNKHEMAIKFLKEAIALNPLHYRAYVQLTLNLLKMKSYKEALHYAAESVSFAPNNKEILAYSYSLAALASEKTKDYKGALQYINQSISLHIQPKYTYARARYYAFLNDINKSISELKRTIERDHSYFALSLVDSAFHPYHREREQLLTAMKMEIESKLDHAITQMESVQLFRYNYEKLSTAELQYNGYDDSIIDYRYNRLHPNFSGYKFISITGVNGKEMYYSYNSLLYHFDDYYYELIELHKNKLPIIKELRSQNTFVDYYKSYREFITFQKEFNYLVENLTRVVHAFKEASETAQQTFKQNLEYSKEIAAETKSDLRKEKGKKVFDILGPVGAIILPYSWQSDHMAEHSLEEINKRVKNVIAEAESNLANESEHTAAIRRLAKQVLVNKPLPNTIG